MHGEVLFHVAAARKTILARYRSCKYTLRMRNLCEHKSSLILPRQYKASLSSAVVHTIWQLKLGDGECNELVSCCTVCTALDGHFDPTGE
jgi:hypothetical protein